MEGQLTHRRPLPRASRRPSLGQRAWRLAGRCLLVMGVALAAVAAPAVAHAQQPQGAKDDLARQLYKRGDQRYGAGDYKGAARDFERAYELSGRAALLYNLGNAYEKLGRFDDALRALRAYLPTAPMGRKVEVEARIVKLEPLAANQRAQGPKPDPQPVTVPVPVPVPVPVSDPDKTPSKPISGMAIAGWSLLGVGVAGLAVGGAFGGLALGARSDADGLCADVGGVRRCPDTAQPALDDDKTFSLVADIGFGVGAAGVAAGVVLLITDLLGGTDDGADKGGDAATEEAPKPETSASLVPVRGGGVFVLGGTF